MPNAGRREKGPKCGSLLLNAGELAALRVGSASRIAPVDLDELELNGGQTRYTQTENVERQTDRQTDREAA